MLNVPIRLIETVRAKLVQTVRPVPADDLLARRHASAVDKGVDAPERVERGGDGGLPVGFAGDVGHLEACRNPQFARQSGARFGVDVE